MKSPPRTFLVAVIIGTVAFTSGCPDDFVPKDTVQWHSKKVTTLLRQAQEKHMVVVLDGTVSDVDAVGVLDPAKIIKAIQIPGDSTAVATYGPNARNGVLLVATHSAEADTTTKKDNHGAATGGDQKPKP